MGIVCGHAIFYTFLYIPCTCTYLESRMRLEYTSEYNSGRIFGLCWATVTELGALVGNETKNKTGLTYLTDATEICQKIYKEIWQATLINLQVG